VVAVIVVLVFSSAGYGFDDRGSISLSGTGMFPLRHRVRTGYEVHPASYLTDTKCCFAGVEVAGACS
jgi:hypothetical protein